MDGVECGGNAILPPAKKNKFKEINVKNISPQMFHFDLISNMDDRRFFLLFVVVF